MRAVAIDAHGGLDQVRLRTDWPEPTAGPGQAVVTVKACGLNYLDIFVLQGMPGLPVTMPRIPGGDISGVVHSVGAGVGREWVGRRVLIDPHIKPGGALGEHANGGLCERIAIEAENLIHMPDAVTFEQAASLPIAYGTAYRMLITRGHLQAGELVLILGASGGVGTGCVQIAKNLKARVIACASSAGQAPAPEGAGRGPRHRLHEGRLLEEGVGDLGQEGRGRARELHGRRHVGAEPAHPGQARPPAHLRRHRRLRSEDRHPLHLAPRGQHHRRQRLDPRRPRSPPLEVERGTIKPIIDRVFPLAESAEAMRLLQDREVFGKVIVTP